MHANVTTWRLATSVQSDEAYAAFISELLEQVLPLGRALGLLDAIIVRVGSDRIMAINLYEDAGNAESAWERASRKIQEHYGDSLEFIDRIVGPANDMPQLTGRGA